MILFYTIISILIGRVNGFFIPCKTQEDCDELDGFGMHKCINHLCLSGDYFIEDYKMVAPNTVTVSTRVTASTTVTVPTTVTASTTATVSTTVRASTTLIAPTTVTVPTTVIARFTCSA